MTGNRFEALALPDVRRISIETALRASSVEWVDACHVTATGSLAKGVRTTGAPAAAIAHLIDLVVWAGLEPDLAVPVSEFPSIGLLEPGDDRAYQEALSGWRSLMTGRRMNLSMSADLALRRFLRTTASDRQASEVLLRSQREFRKTVQTLIAADVRPADFRPVDKLTAVAIEAWTDLELRIPALTAVRDDLWTDPEELEHSDSARVRGLRGRLAATLDRAFGPVDGRRTIVHHGFYFFTPPQWAMFQLLRGVPNLDQVFIVHDDGTNPAFETWRRFFVERWEMPTLRPMSQASQPTVVARALRDALEGRPVDAVVLSDRITIVEHSTPAEFVRDITERTAVAVESGDRPATLFAADAPEIERLVERLGPGDPSGAVDLAHLPVGQFLLSIHDAIKPRGGRIDYVLRPEQVIDIAASGYLDAGDVHDPGSNVGALRRTMPFFRNCHSLQDWQERSVALERLIVDEVSHRGARRTGHSDVERIEIAVQNPLRTVPWADLTVDEAHAVAATIRRIAETVEKIAEYESKSIKDYLEFVRGQLQRGMARLDEHTRSEIDAKLRGFIGGRDAEMDVVGLVEVVRLLLGREADFDHTGESTVETAGVNELRGLDAFGLFMSERDVYLANLAEGAFPTGLPLVGWPLRPMDLLDVEHDLPKISMEIMRTRADTAAISDLYLFWLALDGIPDHHRLTLSWIARSGTELRNPSPILNLVRQPDHWSDAVRGVAGGLSTSRPASSAFDTVRRSHPSVREAVNGDRDAVDLSTIHPAALATAVACPRRFALQWAVGPSGSFGSEHNQIMLFGNVMGALVKRGLMAEQAARRTCKDLWRHISRGERASSYFRRVVQPGAGPRPEWIQFLGGGRKRTDPVSHAYRTAIGDLERPTMDVVGGTSSTVLPGRLDTPEDICLNCPVRGRCSKAEQPRDHT